MSSTGTPTTRVPIPKLATRSSWAWVWGTLLAILAVAGYVAATQPQNRWAVAVVTPLIVLFGVALVVSRTWLDTAEGVLVHQRLRMFTRRVPLEGGKVALVTNNGGTLLLDVRAAGGRPRMYVSVLGLTDYIEESLPAPLLETLADQLDTHRIAGGASVAKQLRKQAEFIANGGHPTKSPLAPQVSRKWLNAAKAGGAAGGGAGLLG